MPTALSPPIATPTVLKLPTLAPLPTATSSPQPTLTLPSTESPSPTATAVPSQTPSPTATPTATAVPILVNGMPVTEFTKLSDEAVVKMREVYTLGQQLGRNGRAFSKVGDSVTLTDHYLTRFDSGNYNLGDYAYLQPAIDHFEGSYARFGVAARIGLHAWSLFDPLWANKEWCQPNEDMVACEIRLHNPAFLLIRMGSNDSGAAVAFENNMRHLVEVSLEQGIVPILATKPDRFEGPDNRNNLIIQELAAQYDLPLWDFDLVSETIPGKGLGGDLVHMTMADADDYTNPDYFKRGYPMSDLTALMMLHTILQEVIQPGDV